MIVVDRSQIDLVKKAVRASTKDLKQKINAATKEQGTPIWVGAVNAHAVTAQEQTILAAGASVGPGNPPHLKAASSGKPLSGGLVPKATWQPFEFGAKSQEKVKEYLTKSRRGTAYTVRRHTSRQLPPRTPKGRVIYPALADAVPAIVAVWVVAVADVFAAATNGDVTNGG